MPGQRGFDRKSFRQNSTIFVPIRAKGEGKRRFHAEVAEGRGGPRRKDRSGSLPFASSAPSREPNSVARKAGSKTWVARQAAKARRGMMGWVSRLVFLAASRLSVRAKVIARELSCRPSLVSAKARRGMTAWVGRPGSWTKAQPLRRADSMRSQKRGLACSASSSPVGRAERKRKSLSEFRLRMRCTTKPSGWRSKYTR